MDEEDEGSKFCEEDIDQILQRRTQTITIESEGKGSTFAKVTSHTYYTHVLYTHTGLTVHLHQVRYRTGILTCTLCYLH